MVTELRVHGVSGSPAESMLDRPLLRCVAGDEEAGFFRPRPQYGDTTGPGGAELEAYRWGNLTAGAAVRALWLLLLPFMLSNVAMWLRPPASRRVAMLIRALCRIFGLTITATFTLALIGVSLDLVAWQCVARERCTQNRSWLKFLTYGFFAPTGRRLAVLAVVPILAVALLWLLGSRTWQRYELYPVPENGDGDGLAASSFWAGRGLVGRLRSVHVALGFGLIAVVLDGVVAARDRSWPGYLLTAGTAALLGICLLAVCLPGMVSRDHPAAWASRLARALRGTAIVLLAASIGYAMLPRDADPPAIGGLPGYALTVTTLFAIQLGLLLVIAFVVLLRPRPAGALLAGFGTPVLSSIALAVAAAFTAGLSYRVADFLDRSSTPTSPTHPNGDALHPPAAYEWSAFGFVIFIAIVALAALAVRAWIRSRLRREARAVTDADFPGDRERDPDRARQIDRTIADGRLTDHLGPIFAWAYLPLAVAALAATGLALAGVGPIELAPAGSTAAVVLASLTKLGTYLIGLATLALLVLGLLAYRYSGIRRVVGVLWDLGTFWPRNGHPLAPPCYAERVVPELVNRATWLAERGGVVLSGHSQGSVLAAAAVLQTPDRVRDQVALLTYGSPLGRLYARLFPAYVNPAVFNCVRASVGGRWWNLWRDTDPIGGAVQNAPNQRLRDPPAFDIQPGDTVYPMIQGHSGYQKQPPFAAAVTDLVGRLR